MGPLLYFLIFCFCGCGCIYIYYTIKGKKLHDKILKKLQTSLKEFHDNLEKNRIIMIKIKETIGDYVPPAESLYSKRLSESYELLEILNEAETTVIKNIEENYKELGDSGKISKIIKSIQVLISESYRLDVNLFALIIATDKLKKGHNEEENSEEFPCTCE